MVNESAQKFADDQHADYSSKLWSHCWRNED